MFESCAQSEKGRFRRQWEIPVGRSQLRSFLMGFRWVRPFPWRPARWQPSRRIERTRDLEGLEGFMSTRTPGRRPHGSRRVTTLAAVLALLTLLTVAPAAP